MIQQLITEYYLPIALIVIGLHLIFTGMAVIGLATLAAAMIYLVYFVN